MYKTYSENIAHLMRFNLTKMILFSLTISNLFISVNAVIYNKNEGRNLTP